MTLSNAGRRPSDHLVETKDRSVQVDTAALSSASDPPGHDPTEAQDTSALVNSTPSPQASRRPSNHLIETQDTSVKWYCEYPGARLTPERQSFFAEYTGLKESDILPHLLYIHKRAWSLRPYPCIGSWNFLRSFMSQMPCYGRVLARVKSGATLLDVGTCLGQDLRQLAADGAPTARLFGCDVVPGFWELGYELFRDRESFHAAFLRADVFDPASALVALAGNVDVVYLGMVLHLFSWGQQVEALVEVVKLSRVGSTVFGNGVGWTRGLEFETGWKNGTRTMFYHDDETMRRIWAEVGEKSGTRWEVRPETVSMERFFTESGDWDWLGPEARMSFFEATRVE